MIELDGLRVARLVYLRSLRVGDRPHIAKDGGVWCVSSPTMQRTWFRTFERACRYARSVRR